ncbi:MAG: TatD family hydrolase, partial [Deltaproteobacteria bacterium]|nr:TatD family hydrolase [Deltaproteobacteria bacterium]
VAWGEIGLDFFHRHSSPDDQIAGFKKQIDLARTFDLPIVIHDRDAHGEVLDILKEKQQGHYKGVFHCFSGDYALAMTLIEMGFHISVPGTVTFRNAAQMQDVAARIPLERMLVETDAPFLAPVPRRGERNEPAFVTHTVDKVARLRGMDTDVVARQTAENTMRVFKLPNRP